ncbi:diguanylate cyclase (GGDEF)-like protein [Actinoplanes lutulentus]|uniref:Diguanylate cyclase/phosphodiesterase n=1 Tax=Actinoplanes lutulentus TaxID=1287878 RepID=A0A327ZH56_9ACTN|nr:bifunctional diguanylate cyclase/phosphodiesterase [Actinoplanes lutulentus]MBB2944755.1 diguanylate cyclase (GGDEF)-like protein [Actinoplanes lutulentus]RAK35451.1 diguanylate cyclase/phosphodiesterase [Actinoplanes lutulentus]
MTETSTNDDATDRRLRLLIGLVVVAALITTAGWVLYLLHNPGPIPAPWALALLSVAVVAANRLKVSVRIRSSLDGTTWGEVPVLVGLILFPAPWVVLCSVAGVTALKIFARQGSLKTVFAAAKEALTASAAGLVFLVAGVQPDMLEPSFAPLAIVIALAAFTLVDNVVFVPVMAVNTQTSVRLAALKNSKRKLLGFLGQLAASLLVAGLLAADANMLLLLVVPLVVACMHLWQSRSARTREERESWQRLAKATDELNAVDLTQVLHAATTRAAQIFSAAEATIDVTAGGARRTVRATDSHVLTDGPLLTAPPQRDEKSVDLVAHDGGMRVGVLRLGFGGAVRLTEVEQYKLRTFASAVCTAIRNAQAYAELARIAAENEHAATHDPLTGLANRRRLYEHAGDLYQSTDQAGLFALLLIDLNHFKEVNDTLGHAAGDDVLREVAGRLSDAAAEGDLVARLGGDEFAVLMTGLPTPALATHRATSMLTSLDASIEVEGMQITVDAAGGIALAAGSGGVEELMRRADIAMYQAKRTGQPTAIYVHARDTADLERLMLTGDLRRAVAEHEFSVEFQPIVDLGSGEVVSAEALARWRHPAQGSLTPVQFLETVERSGQLPAFADAVLEQSLIAMQTWREAGFDLPVAVNVSPRSLLDPKFPATVLARLARHDVPANRLTLELAETLTISQLEVVERALAELRNAGVRLAIDDFGTGVSSLSVLSRIPVHQLKIDREFVAAVETSAEASAVIRTTVDLARNLHLTVVAEGVESEPQRRALWELGCLAGQGHLFARPYSAARFLAALQRGSGGRPGVLAAALHDAGAVVRMPVRRAGGTGRSPLPHLPA